MLLLVFALQLALLLRPLSDRVFLCHARL
ncbi:hypothetical protein CP061683_0906A, partial [Chlamydia psittaci 06-1683]